MTAEGSTPGTGASGATDRGLVLLAADDEVSQLDDLARMLRASPLVAEVECARDGREALLRSSEGRFDAIFLDVRMPGIGGLELARVLRRFARPPCLVFVSAYDSAAVDAFELEAVDYLRKPVARSRLAQALGRVAEAVEAGEGTGRTPAPNRPLTAPEADGGVVAVGLPRGGTRLIPRDEILYAQAHGDYVRIVTAEGRYLLRATVGELERRWAGYGFVRVHRARVANLRRAVEIRPDLGSGAAELIFASGHAIPISRRHVGELRRRLAA